MNVRVAESVAPPPRWDVATCVRRARKQDEEAARLLVQQLYPLVIKIVRAHLPKRMEEEDLAQMILVKMFAGLHQYSGKVPFEHWVSRIAVNTCLNQLRFEKCRPELRWADLGEDEAEFLSRVMCASTAPSPAEELASRELAGKLLELLSPVDRLILQNLDVEGRSVEEISQATGWSRTKIKVRAFRARRKLHKQLDKLMRVNTP